MLEFVFGDTYAKKQSSFQKRAPDFLYPNHIDVADVFTQAPHIFFSLRRCHLINAQQHPNEKIYCGERVGFVPLPS